MPKSTLSRPRLRSGRQTEIPGAFTKRFNFTLDERTVRLLHILGAGNASRGVRVAADAAFDAYQAGRLELPNEKSPC